MRRDLCGIAFEEDDMGKKIDRFVLTLAVAAGLYFYFLDRLGNRLAALALALLCCTLVCKLARKLWTLAAQGRLARMRRIRRCASGAAMKLACMDEPEARERLERLLRVSYGEDCPLELIQLHPSGKLSQERLFDAWRAHRGEEKLAVCATCAADTDCRLLAQSLKSPRVALVDAELLKQLVAEHPDGFDCAEVRRPRKFLPALRRAGSMLFNRANAPRGLLFAGAMFLIYALSGHLSYLIASMALLFVTLVSLRRPPRPAKLF